MFRKHDNMLPSKAHDTIMLEKEWEYQECRCIFVAALHVFPFSWILITQSLQQSPLTFVVINFVTAKMTSVIMPSGAKIELTVPVVICVCW